MKIIILLILAFSFNLFAQDKDPLIPFIITKTIVKDSKGKKVAQDMYGWSGDLLVHGQGGKTKYVVSQVKDTKLIKSSTITKIVSDTKNALCVAIGKGEFKVWLKVDAGGKIWGVGLSGEGGIEVTVKCDEVEKITTN